MSHQTIPEPAKQPENNTYQTGYTEPPKNRKGFFSVLLMAVIFVSGLITILEKMNIHLTEKLTNPEPEMCAVAFASPESPETSMAAYTPLGFSGEAVPPFWQEFDTLPPGLYITDVSHACQAASLGILPGDILLTANDQPVPDWNTFLALLDSKAPGEPIRITIYRQGSLYDYSLTMP